MSDMLRTFTVSNVQLTVKISPEFGNGGLVWPSTFFLAEHLRKKMSFKGVRMAELGAGTGLLGIWLATQGAHVVLTDLAELVPLLTENVRLNISRIKAGGGSCIVEALLWGKTELPVSVMDSKIIVGSDLVHWIAFTLFDDDSRALLCQTMLSLLQAGSDKDVYLCHEIRTQQREAQFLLMINDIGLRAHQEQILSYSPLVDGGTTGSGFVFNSLGACASDCRKISGDSMCFTTQSSTDLDGGIRDVVILRINFEV